MKSIKINSVLLALSLVVGMFALMAEATPGRTSRPPANWGAFFQTATESQVRYELRHGLDPNNVPGGVNPLNVVIWFNNHNAGVVRALLEAGADPHADFLMAAANRGHFIAVRELIEGGADVNAVINDTTAIRLAAKRRQAMPEMVIFLLEAGADPTLGRGSTGVAVTGWSDRRSIPIYEEFTVRNNLEGTEAFRLLQQRTRELSR